MTRRALVYIAVLLPSTPLLSCVRHDEPTDVSDGDVPKDANGAGGAGGCTIDEGGCTSGPGGVGGGGSGGVGGSDGSAGNGGAAGSSGSAGSAGKGGSGGSTGGGGKGGSGGNAGGLGGTSGRSGSGGVTGNSGAAGIGGNSGSGGVAGNSGAAGIGGNSGSNGGTDAGQGGAASDGGDGGPTFCVDGGSDGSTILDAPATTERCVTVYDVDKTTYTGPTPLTYTCNACKSTTNPQGPSACRRATDCEMIATGLVRNLVRDCALSCRDQEPPIGTCSAAMECNRQCLKDATATKIGPPGLSDECGRCHTHAVLCSFAYCLSECAANADALGCIQCQFAAGCTAQFERCSGLDRRE